MDCVHPITRIRKEQKLSQRALAREAKVHQDTVRLAEQGVLRDGPKALTKIATALGTTVAEIQGEMYSDAQTFMKEVVGEYQDTRDLHLLVEAASRAFLWLARAGHPDPGQLINVFLAEVVPVKTTAACENCDCGSDVYEVS
jgi:transcriptional regulator with XRE-family HTH domain